MAISYRFFIAPIPKFIEDFNETINHWFWRNPHQGPYSFESGSVTWVQYRQVIRLWVRQTDRLAVGSRVGGGGNLQLTGSGQVVGWSPTHAGGNRIGSEHAVL